MPPKSKRNAVNQQRHDNGLAAPGKRIPKQKSSQNLAAAANANANAHAKSTSTPPLPPIDVASAAHFSVPPSTPNGSTNANHPDVNMPNGSAAAAARLHERRERSMSDLSLDARPDGYALDGASAPLDSARPSSPSRYNDAAVNVPPSAHKGSFIALATTILSSCPLRDVIAILIILLQLGPTTLTIVHFLFSALTFVPSGSPTSLSTLPSLSDMFQGSGGSPSLSLIVFVDIFILVIWLLLWVPLQNFILDLAQAVIAISLGGAAAGKDSTTNSL